MVIIFVTIFLIFVLLWLSLKYIKKNNIYSVLEETGFSTYSDHISKVDYEALNKCQVPTLNTQQCYNSRHYECPIVNGSYLQCTNNYIPKPNTFNSDCGNRTFDMVPYPEKISENCYYNQIGFDRDMIFPKVRFN
jgi:hypothetical protein